MIRKINIRIYTDAQYEVHPSVLEYVERIKGLYEVRHIVVTPGRIPPNGARYVTVEAEVEARMIK